MLEFSSSVGLMVIAINFIIEIIFINFDAKLLTILILTIDLCNHHNHHDPKVTWAQPPASVGKKVRLAISRDPRTENHHRGNKDDKGGKNKAMKMTTISMIPRVWRTR